MRQLKPGNLSRENFASQGLGKATYFKARERGVAINPGLKGSTCLTFLLATRKARNS